MVARDGFLDGMPDEPDPAPTTKDDIAIWKFTTGSTGQPKAAVHPAHSAVLSCEWYAKDVLGLREDDVILPVPLFFGYARDLAALFPFAVGAAGIVFPERSTPERIFELIAEHRPTILVNVPTMMAQMLEHPEHDLSCLRFCTSAGEALPESSTTAGSRRSASRCWTGSARPRRTTSTSPTGPAACARRPASSSPATQAHIAENGELWIEGDTAALLYWGEHEKTKQTFHGDTVKTGDLFERDEDGYFWYRGAWTI